MAPRRRSVARWSESGTAEPFIRAVALNPRKPITEPDRYPFNLPALRGFESLAMHPKVTYLIGENGSGKSTLIEAIAIAAGFNAEGGSQNMRFSVRPSESVLHQHLVLVRGTQRPRTGYFLRAESFFNVATQVDQIPDALHSHGGRSLHEQSHGESFLALLNNRFGPNGFYVLDEPEAALSPQRQLSLLKTIDILVRHGNSQFLIATHSPLVLAYPDAQRYQLGPHGIAPVEYEATEHYALTRDFLNNREAYLCRLFAED